MCPTLLRCTVYNHLNCRYSKLSLFKEPLDTQIIIDAQFEKLVLTSYTTLVFEHGDPPSTSSNLGKNRTVESDQSLWKFSVRWNGFLSERITWRKFKFKFNHGYNRDLRWQSTFIDSDGSGDDGPNGPNRRSTPGLSAYSHHVPMRRPSGNFCFNNVAITERTTCYTHQLLKNSARTPADRCWPLSELLSEPFLYSESPVFCLGYKENNCNMWFVPVTRIGTLTFNCHRRHSFRRAIVGSVSSLEQV